MFVQVQKISKSIDFNIKVNHCDFPKLYFFSQFSGLFYYSEKSSSRNAKANEMTHFQIGGQNG